MLFNTLTFAMLLFVVCCCGGYCCFQASCSRKISTSLGMDLSLGGVLVCLLLTRLKKKKIVLWRNGNHVWLDGSGMVDSVCASLGRSAHCAELDLCRHCACHV